MKQCFDTNVRPMSIEQCLDLEQLVRNQGQQFGVESPLNQTHTHSVKYTQSHAHEKTHAQTHINAHKQCAHARAHTHARKHARTHTHSDSQPHTTHTQTQMRRVHADNHLEEIESSRWHVNK